MAAQVPLLLGFGISSVNLLLIFEEGRALGVGGPMFPPTVCTQALMGLHFALGVGMELAAVGANLNFIRAGAGGVAVGLAIVASQVGDFAGVDVIDLVCFYYGRGFRSVEGDLYGGSGIPLFSEDPSYVGDHIVFVI